MPLLTGTKARRIRYGSCGCADERPARRPDLFYFFQCSVPSFKVFGSVFRQRDEIESSAPRDPAVAGIHTVHRTIAATILSHHHIVYICDCVTRRI